MENYLIIALIVFVLSFWVWAVTDILRSDFDNSVVRKVLLLLLVTAMPLAGPVIYFQMKAGFFRKEARKFNPDFKASRH